MLQRRVEFLDTLRAAWYGGIEDFDQVVDCKKVKSTEFPQAMFWSPAVIRRQRLAHDVLMQL